MAEITTTQNKGSRLMPSWAWISFALLVVFAYFFGLDLPLLGPDEPRYAQVAREMFERGDWITPTLGGHNWFEKPALLYWFEIASFNIFGVSEFAARVAPALFGLGTIASLWILGRTFATDGTEKPEVKSDSSATSVHSVAGSFANWLALIAASTLGIMVFSRGASFDITVTFPMTAAMVSFFLFDRSGKISPLISFYFFIGVAMLAKGLIGIVFPFAIVAFYFVLGRRMPGRAFVLSLIWGTLIASAVAAIWYVPMYLRHGWEFVDEFFLQHHFQRFTSNKYQHPQPFFFFLWVLPLMTLPWLPFFIGAVWKLVKDSVRRVSASPSLAVSFSPLLLFSFAWLIVPLVFFSFSGSKLPGYILPAVPPAIVITALYVFELLRQPKWRYMVAAISATTLIVAILLLVTVVPRFADLDSVRSLIAAGDARGLGSSKVLTLHTISHNAEFYAARRLLRDETGRQRKLYGVTEVVNIIAENNGEPALVLVPLEYQYQLASDARVNVDALKDNGELMIFAVSVK